MKEGYPLTGQHHLQCPLGNSATLLPEVEDYLVPGKPDIRDVVVVLRVPHKEHVPPLSEQ